MKTVPHDVLTNPDSIGYHLEVVEVLIPTFSGIATATFTIVCIGQKRRLYWSLNHFQQSLLN